MDIVAHWLDLINQEGWIPREQILGEEARSRVPGEFLNQDPTVGNPPTLFLSILHFAEQENSFEFLRLAWPRLVKWFEWIWANHRTTDEESLSFRWTSREVNVLHKLNPLTLDSGLDDYPRASHPSPSERHLDLRCWITFLAETMHKIGQKLNIPSEELARYSEARDLLEDMDLLKKLHYDEQTGWFVDYGMHSDQIILKKVQDANTLEWKMIRSVEKPPVFQRVRHFGYVSLFPLFLHLISASDPLLEQQLKLLEDPELLWTEFGLRSLSKTSAFYQKHNSEHDPPYWRGAIWINMNYLALRALKYYSLEPGPYADFAKTLHTKLKTNVVGNVLKQYEKTGFLWEQYDDTTGEGKGCRPFSGWTALILLM